MKTHLVWLHQLALATILVFTFTLYLGLGKDYLFEWDEAIYAQLGVELRTIPDLITPHWNSELWLEKPPTIALVTALGQSLVADPELGQLAQRVRKQVDPDAESADRGAAFVDRDVPKPGLVKADGGGQPADARADDDDLHRSLLISAPRERR